MEEREIKNDDSRLIVQDIKKVDTKKISAKDIKEQLSFKKKLFFKLFILVGVLILLALTASFFYFRNKNHNTKEDLELEKDLSYYADKVTEKLDSIGIPSGVKEDLDDEGINEADKKTLEEENLGKILEEASSMKKSKNDDWWLNSGGVMYFQEKEFSTNMGALPDNSYWRKLYAKNNSRDTDDGYFPQNIFRLVNREERKNFSQSVYFNIEKINLSESKYRNESNGVLLFNRYQDGNNLYYVGVRVDGLAIVKKKIDGEYFTITEKNIFKNEKKYNRNSNPNLIPENKWIGIKSELENSKDDEVKINLFVDLGDGNWKLIIEARDMEDKYGEAPFLNKGYSGIRTDFMDVRFRDYEIDEK